MRESGHVQRVVGRALAEPALAGIVDGMPVEFHYVMRASVPRAGFEDLDLVALTAEATTDDGDVMPVGSEGTVVGIWRDGEAYIVEFPEPVGALATVGPGGIRAVERGER